jgi:hypothetical protein
MLFDQHYYENRAEEERELASASTDGRAAKVHLDMASRYDALARGDEVWDDESLKKLSKRLTLTGERTMRLIRTDTELIDRSETAVEKSQDLLRATARIPRRHPHS